MEFLLIFVLIAAGVFVVKGFVPIQQSRCAVVERMGKYHKVLNPGWHVINPVLDTVVKRFDMRETLHDFPPASVITKDNVTVRLNAVTYYRVTDVKSAAYNVQSYEQAMEQLSITTLRNLIGEMELDEVLNGRNIINSKLQGILDEATHAWGLKVSRVELKEVTPQGEVAEAMDKQMVAERTRRAQILEAEGSKKSAVLQAEGAKEAAILRAEGEREVVLIKAKAEAEAALIAAKAQQEAIREIVSAFGAHGEEKFLQLRYLDTLPKMADGRGSTVFMPTQLGQVAGHAALAGEAFRATQAAPQQQAAAQQRPQQPGQTNVRIS
jgi:regulator of protease activity HflC (stomatin/prohibitin superfamily)